MNDIAMLTGETNFQLLSQKMNYYVHTSMLLNLQKGIYATPGYKVEELACTIETIGLLRFYKEFPILC